MRPDLRLLLALLAGPALGQELAPETEAVVVPEDEEPLEVAADLRFRQEASLDVAGVPDRHRSRVRLRLSAAYALEEDLQVGARLTSGDPDDPRSPHVTLGDGLDAFDLNIDRAFARWLATEGTAITLGKFGNPMRRNPVYGELVWDCDVQPEGVAVETQVGPYGLTFGRYSLQEFATRDDAWLTFAEAEAHAELGGGVRGGLSAAYTFVDRADAAIGDNRGNAQSGGAYASEFGVLDLIADVRFTDWVVSLEAIENLRAEDDGRGWAAGFTWGRQEEVGDWRLGYQLQSLEQDAVFSPLAQDDFLFATGHRSHLLSIERRLSEAVGLRVWGLASEPEAGGDEAWRLRVDLNLAF